MTLGCREFTPLLDELVDGGLDPARARGVRGHVHACAACAARLADLEAMKRAAHELEAMEPPPSLWDGIASRLAADERASAARPSWWWWWQAQRGRLVLGAGALAVAGAAFLAWTTMPRGELGVDAVAVRLPARPAEMPAAPIAPPVVRDAFDEVADEIQRADDEYAQVMARLEAVVATERPRWSPAAARAFDGGLAALDAKVAAQRAAFRAAPDDVATLDALHASYRARLEFLQEAAIRGDGALLAQAEPGGRGSSR